MLREVCHAFLTTQDLVNQRPLCGEGTHGFGTIDALYHKAVTCPACLRIISEVTIAKMRTLGVNVTPESEHHCSASIAMKIERDSLLEQNAEQRELLRRTETRVSERIVPYERARRDFDSAVTQLRDRVKILELENRQLKEDNGILRATRAVAGQGPGIRTARTPVALAVSIPSRPSPRSAVTVTPVPGPSSTTAQPPPSPPPPPKAAPQPAEEEDAASRRFALLELD